MAVSVNVGIELNNYFRKNTTHNSECVEKSELSSPLNETKMKTARKERRKPEMQIYRPKMGLHSKNSKIEEINQSGSKNTSDPNSVSPTNDCISEQANTQEGHVNEVGSTGSLNCDASKSSKNTKNRRPDLQVYTPKPRLIAQSQEKKSESTRSSSQVSPKDTDSHAKSSFKKRPSHLPNVKDSSESRPNKAQTLPEETCSKPAVRNISSKQFESNIPLRTESWADLVENSDLANSRSAPEDKLCNGHVENTNACVPSKENETKQRRNKSSRQKCNKEDSSKRHRVRRNSYQSESSYPTCRESSTNDFSHMELNETKHLTCDDNRFNSLPKKEVHRMPGKGKKSPDSLEDQRDSVSISEFIDQVQKVKIHNDEVQQRSFVTENKAKSEKNKRIDAPIPPRFQKNKAQNSDTHSISPSNYNSSSPGGILKLPLNFERCENGTDTVENTVYVPKLYQEPPVFIHKQLFDPNNPTKPEIVNIPAHLPPTHMSYPNLSPNYCLNDPSYIASSIQTMGYIPPPQPPIMNPPYCYMRPEVAINGFPDSYMNPRDAIPPPVQCTTVPDVHMNTGYSRSPVCFGEIPPAQPEPGKKKLKPIVEKNLNDISLLERQLTSLLAQGFSDTNLNALRLCRWKVQLRYENIILADPKYCAERNLEQCMWKSCFYQIIELLRKKIDENPQDKEETKSILLNMISEGIAFYENLIEKQQETYGFNLTRILECESMNAAHVHETIRIALISTQKILIYLGDLARYREQVSQTANYGKARSWYSKAQRIAPKNGRPYHQLAILGFNTRRKLDAVYYYMRSLAASNPILSAKESLLSLFEEAKKKYEQFEKKRKPEAVDELEIVDESIGKRYEMWIKPDGSSNQRPAEVDKNLDSSELKNLSDVELNKRFVTSFLHVHGKLFTKVGMETFPDTLNHMLKEFYFMLQRSPLPITSSRMLQLLAINIFSVDNSSMKESGREHGGCSLLQEQALYTSQVMMSVLMDRCQMLHVAHKSSPEYSNQMISDDLAQLLPSVKIWTDWMSCQKSLWAPNPNYVLEKLNMTFRKNIWISFADLLTVLREIDLSVPLIIHIRKDGCEPVILEEDTQFAGFVPLLSALQDPTYAVLPFDKDQAKHCVRISRIQFFGDYLCGISPPCMEFDIESKKFVSLMDQVYSEDIERSVLHNSYDELLREENLNCNFSGKTYHDNPESNELQLLWSKKEALSKTKEQQERYRAQVQAVLQKNQSQRPILLKIKPRYLIPDTNCFIDHLQLFRNILSSTDFHLIIPLVVINELDGLARGTRVNEHSSPEHANRVTVLSREAISFLEEQFALRNPHLRAITSKGSVIDTISFRSEEISKNKGTNDDLILSCCLFYCEDRAEEYMPKNMDDPITLFRKVVLLTDDRNLRVKALAHHVPVRDLISFLQWANS